MIKDLGFILENFQDLDVVWTDPDGGAVHQVVSIQRESAMLGEPIHHEEVLNIQYDNWTSPSHAQVTGDEITAYELENPVMSGDFLYTDKGKQTFKDGEILKVLHFNDEIEDLEHAYDGAIETSNPEVFFVVGIKYNVHMISDRQLELRKLENEDN